MHAQPGQAHAPPCPAHAVACSMSSLAKLRELKLYDNRLLCLDGLQGLSSLHTLDISSNRLSSLEVRAAWLRGCAAMCQARVRARSARRECHKALCRTCVHVDGLVVRVHMLWAGFQTCHTSCVAVHCGLPGSIKP